MYFDDASRHHINIPWKPDDGMPSPNRSEEKHDAVKRILLGYNAESASLLSEDEGTCSSFFVHLFRFNYLEIMLLVFFFVSLVFIHTISCFTIESIESLETDEALGVQRGRSR
jgi:hypothetical protein